MMSVVGWGNSPQGFEARLRKVGRLYQHGEICMGEGKNHIHSDYRHFVSLA